MFRPIKSQRIVDTIFNQIMDMIIQQKLKSGDKLPPERIIAEEMQCSRSAVREALKMLEHSGVVQTIQGAQGGCFVKESNLDGVASSITLLYKLGQVSMMELIEVRKILEVTTAGKAAKRMTPNELNQIKENVCQLQKSYKDKAFMIQNNREFHRLIAQFSGNTMLLLLMNTILDSIDHSVEQLITTDENREKVLRSHMRILDAFERRDEQLAMEAMEQHIGGMEKNVENMIKGLKVKDEVNIIETVKKI
ncbi:FadR/GntR family transcriptional regulator [Ammoniphilus sp. CFH 90114]|uniref:FadR/GntR family transcriptional regulator n=1 Tax=Ammoniphilus sp. CFH 90114 TaxID=2493665 RepID=UPI00100D9E9B|nr:FadR/GntR family transcriptional regulator [Ammoniphilus sp. CFH 90114]RXT07140.1 FadR family transcriptional regulator [Ammoniphilus sp. CFH 90114]